jgi:hypothetical protein
MSKIFTSCCPGVLVAVAAIIGPVVAAAAPNACPQDGLLAITGLVKPNAANGAFLFGEPDFLKLKNTKLTTATAWTPRSEFVGPELSTVLATAGVPQSAKEMRFYAIDAYEITIPISDVTKYNPVMAHTQNGKRLEISTRGPVFLVYPRDQHPELLAIKGQAQFVWMVCKIDVR